MNLEDAMAKRRSMRHFSNQKIDAELLKTIVNQAQRAPSWENSQPWKVYIATGKTLEAIKAKHQQHIADKAEGWAEIVPPQANDWAAYPKNNIDNLFKELAQALGEDGLKEFGELNAKLFNASATVYITVPKNATPYSIYDAGGFGYALLLAAYGQGIGSVPAYELIRYPNDIRAHFDISDDEAILIGIALGYPEDDKINDIRTARNTMETVLQIKD